MNKSKNDRQNDYHKSTANPTTNYPKDSHKKFCKRCLAYNAGCPITGTAKPSGRCDL